ncbi:shikimate kinase [Acetivibrio straminisolvens]|jgi:shikimate kinase|uniref:Shikimate kinase n=1 Tax=Acetivibrio straminisolvens JCM 21531 TaxID=1294263 RepID=W4VA51_9FIRM|nr:shikimate kinase [Acetivibrio straminisolvens]GAE90051.1 shikimate kinase I [Acetivibrio straminisolvens JCM 21531]
MKKGNIVLIGMPSSGKTTIGEPLAKTLSMGFVDTDKIITDKEKRPLRDIVNQDGLEKFLEIQQSVLMNLDVSNHVISTGGSVVYSESAMEHLKKNSIVVYLKLEFDEIKRRLSSARRLARDSSKSFEDIYKERVPLYEKYADVTINCSSKSVLSIVAEIKDVYETKYKGI